MCIRDSLPKESGRFDLPIALGILAANGLIPADALAGREFAGELSLTGALRPMRGAFAMACGTARDRQGGRVDPAVPPPREPELYLPLDSAAEAALVPGVTVFGAPDLPALCAHLTGAPDGRLSPVAAPCLDRQPVPAAPDLADVIGQRGGRRALEVLSLIHI